MAVASKNLDKAIADLEVSSKTNKDAALQRIKLIQRRMEIKRDQEVDAMVKSGQVFIPGVF